MPRPQPHIKEPPPPVLPPLEDEDENREHHGSWFVCAICGADGPADELCEPVPVTVQ